MKTIKKNGEVKRVEDTQADTMVTLGGWEFCTKEEWKKNRKVKKVNNNTPTDLDIEDISDNLSDKKKRKLRKENKRKKYESK